MKTFKRLLALALICFLLLPIASFCALAADSSKWTFIDGENITRRVNTAIVYRNLPSSGQNQWGINLIVDTSGTVTEIFSAGDKNGIDLKIPEGGAVISASGVRLGWFEDNVRVGSKLYYDSYTQKLFLCDANGKFDPFFTENATVSGSGNAFMIAHPSVDGTPPYTYDIAVDSNGTVVERGGGIEAPENGFILSAATEDDRNFLIMYAPIGAKCVIKDGVATFTYSTAMLKKTAQLAFDFAKAQADAAKAEFRSIDTIALDSAIEAAKSGATTATDYKTVMDYVSTLFGNINNLCSERYISELRGAFHTPTETDAYAVYETVTKAKASGINTIILRVTNGYNSIVPLPEDNKFSQNSIFNGNDILQSYINACEQEGIALSLCFDVYYNENAATAATEWLSETNGSEKGLSKKYFSPANEEFKAYYLDYIKYVITKYPSINSIMFDYLRYPRFHQSCDLGYDYLTMERFATEQGVLLADVEAIKKELFDSPLWSKWNEYRQGLVTGMAQSLSSVVRENRPDMTVNIVAARDTVNYYYQQDALSWIDNGLFDGLCLALYEGDSDENDVIDENAYYDGLVASKSELFTAYTGRKAFFFAALESGKKLTPDVLANAVSETRSIGADGFVLSDLNEYLAQNYYTYLSQNALKGTAVSPFGDTAEVMKAVLEYAKAKINGSIFALGAYDESTAALACTKINEAIAIVNEQPLTHEQASKLREEMSILFAASGAKSRILLEFDSLTKLALLAKSKAEDGEGPAQGIGGTSSDVTSGEHTHAPNQSEAESKSESKTDFIADFKLDVDFGTVLIYSFVGVALVAAIVGTVVTIRRKRALPPKHHMPKGFEEGTKDEENL